MSEVQKYEQDEQGRWPLILHPQMVDDLGDAAEGFPYMLSVPRASSAGSGETP